MAEAWVAFRVKFRVVLICNPRRFTEQSDFKKLHKALMDEIVRNLLFTYMYFWFFLVGNKNDYTSRQNRRARCPECDDFANKLKKAKRWGRLNKWICYDRITFLLSSTYNNHRWFYFEGITPKCILKKSLTKMKIKEEKF